MKAYETYLFDLDGTITDTVSVWLGILRDGLIKFNMTPPDDKTLAHYSHDWKQLKHIGFPEDKFDELRDFIYGLANSRLPEAQFHTGAYETLEQLKNKGKKLGIFSSLDRAMFDPAMEHRNLFTLVDAAIAGNDIPERKPNPAGIFKALEKLGVSENSYGSVVYIGDKETDIQTAHSAGVASILYYPIAHSMIYDLSDLRKHKPTHIIREWKELID